jgi:hypothetical protein
MTTSTFRTGPGPLAGIGARFMSGVKAISNASRGARCLREAERLSRLSDDELARRGLKRDQIVQHAFRSYLHL